MGTDGTRGHITSLSLYYFFIDHQTQHPPPVPGHGAGRGRPGARDRSLRSAPGARRGTARPCPALPGLARPRRAEPASGGNASQRRVLPPGGGGGDGHGAVAAAAASFLGPAAVEAAGPGLGPGLGQRGAGRLPTAPHGRQLLAELALVGAAGRGRLLHSLPGLWGGGGVMGCGGARGVLRVRWFCPQGEVGLGGFVPCGVCVAVGVGLCRRVSQ